MLNKFICTGADAVFTCITSGDSASVITFHTSSDGSDASKVDTVVITSDSASAQAGQLVNTTGVLTFTPDSSTSSKFYCKATWDQESVISDAAYLSLLEVDELPEKTWALSGHLAVVHCLSNASLISNGNNSAGRWHLLF